MKLDASIEQALHSAEPIHALRSLAQELLSHGKDGAAVLAVFENARRRLREAGREADEDAVLDVMDFLAGWCSPHMKLAPGDGAELRANGATVVPQHSPPIQPASEEPRP